MAENSAIEWCDHTFNPWIGCTRVGPGCDHCYAADLSRARLGVEWGPGKPRRHTAASTWKQPRAWDRRAAKLGIRYRVFCASLADVFDNEVPVEWRIELFQLIRETPNLDWLLVTKRIGNAERMVQGAGDWPANVWLGATVVNQAEADRDVPKLLAIEGPRFRFLSMEPLLGAVDLSLFSYVDADGDELSHSALTGAGIFYEPGSDEPFELPRLYAPRLDWIIVGGESGPGARPMDPDWARDLRDQCAEAGVPFLFKQWGDWAPGECAAASLKRRSVLTADWWDTDWTIEEVRGDFEFHADDEPDLFRVGKKAAGRLLDGVQHDGVPA